MQLRWHRLEDGSTKPKRHKRTFSFFLLLLRTHESCGFRNADSAAQFTPGPVAGFPTVLFSAPHYTFNSLKRAFIFIFALAVIRHVAVVVMTEACGSAPAAAARACADRRIDVRRALLNQRQAVHENATEE